MKIRSVSAGSLTRNAPPGINPDHAHVVISLDDGSEITVDVHQSQRYANTIAVDIDANLTDGDPSLRINLNDDLIYDSANEPGLTSPRKPNLGNADIDDDQAGPHVTVTVGTGSSRETTLALPVNDLGFIDVNGVTVAGIDPAGGTIGTWVGPDQEEWVRAIEIGPALGVPVGQGMGFPDQ